LDENEKIFVDHVVGVDDGNESDDEKKATQGILIFVEKNSTGDNAEKTGHEG
jgi:hypothetical protein